MPRKKEPSFAIVAGGGTVGTNVTRSLLDMGHEETLIEQRRERFELLEEEFSHVPVLGDATGRPVWVVRASAEAGSLTAAPVGASPTPRQVPELWLIPAGGAPISLGLLDQQGESRSTLRPPAQARLRPGDTLAVSLEPPGGSPTGQPTGPVVSTGVLVPEPG